MNKNSWIPLLVVPTNSWVPVRSALISALLTTHCVFLVAGSSFIIVEDLLQFWWGKNCKVIHILNQINLEQRTKTLAGNNNVLIFHIQNVSDILFCPFILWSINKHCTTPNGHVGVHGMTYISQRLNKTPATLCSSASSATSSATWWSCMAMAMVWLLENKRDFSHKKYPKTMGLIQRRTPIKSKASLQKQRSRCARRLPNCCQSNMAKPLWFSKGPMETNSYIGVAPSTFTCPGNITGVQWWFYSVVFLSRKFST